MNKMLGICLTISLWVCHQNTILAQVFPKDTIELTLEPDSLDLVFTDNWNEALVLEELKKFLASCSQLNHVKKLTMRVRGFAKQSLDSLCNLSNLRYLELYSHQAVFPNCLDKSTNLDTIRYWHDIDMEFPMVLTRMPHLKYLVFLHGDNDGNLTSIPAEIGNLEGLIRLGFGKTNVDNLPSEIGKLRQLEYLFIAGSNLQTLPPEIGNLSKLKELYLDCNTGKKLWLSDIGEVEEAGNFNKLPPEIGKLQNLEELYLYGTKLNTLPPEIGALKKLKIFSIFGNELASLPPEIGKLRQLKMLQTKGVFYKLPTQIGRLVKLTTLDISSRNLTTLPRQIGKLQQLTSLSIKKSSINHFPKSIKRLKKLKFLVWLNNNNLTPAILEKELAKLYKPSIVHLYLSSNNLETLPNVISEFKNLRTLYLRGNSFSEEEKKRIQQAFPHCEIDF